MWDMIQQRNPVWHFDASGLFLNEINDQSKPLLFSIVCHDPIAKSFIPIADFFTPANDSLNIQLNLIRIQSTFLRYKKSYNPSVIVTDFSWASINALLRTFLNCDIIQYLKISFEKAIKFNNSYDKIFKTKIFLCSTHFLKNVIDDFDTRTKRMKISKKVRYCFIICFTLLQNSKTINEFNDNLLHFYTIFSEKYLSDKCMVSLLKMEINIKIRNVSWIKDLFQDNESNVLFKNEDLRKEIIFQNDFSNNYMRDSPFTKYFGELIDGFQEINKIHIETNPRNEFYYPNLMDIIKKRLHIAPLWSAFIISSESINFPHKTDLSRFTNNPVEAWFAYFRNHILNINKRVKLIRRLNPSEIVTPYYNYLQMKFNQHYKNICIDFSKKENLDPKNEKNTEKWNFPTTSKRIKGIYYTDKFNFRGNVDSNDLINIPDLVTKKSSIFFNNNSEEFSKKINNFVCFNVLGEKIRFKDILDLLKGKMINDLVSLIKYIFLTLLHETHMKINRIIHSLSIRVKGKRFQFYSLFNFFKIITMFMELNSIDLKVKIFNYYQSSQIFDQKKNQENFLSKEVT